jgi:hypothetical protein
MQAFVIPYLATFLTAAPFGIVAPGAVALWADGFGRAALDTVFVGTEAGLDAEASAPLGAIAAFGAAALFFWATFTHFPIGSTLTSAFLYIVASLLASVPGIRRGP